jgi:ABC-type glycerol-3-phosphate transport system permease component
MTRVRNQTLLFVALTIFTFINLVPLIWAALTSIKNPADAFTVPPSQSLVRSRLCSLPDQQPDRLVGHGAHLGPDR